MFEVGKAYEFRMLEGGNETSWTAVVERYDHPLLKTADKTFSDKSPFLAGGTIPGQIINVASFAFIGASMSKHQPGAFEDHG